MSKPSDAYFRTVVLNLGLKRLTDESPDQRATHLFLSDFSPFIIAI